jgi:hypothetical protein
MADDQSQRPYRASEPPPARGSGKTSGSDPLAELARLIGQTDPFGEFGREAARRSPPSQSVARADWNQPLGTSYTAQYGGDARASEPTFRYAASDPYASHSRPTSAPIPQDYDRLGYERQIYGPQESDSGTDHFEAGHGNDLTPGQSDYQQDFYDEAPAEDEYFEDAKPSRRRMAAMVIAGVVALAVIGTAGAFGYRALVGSSASTKPPPVIKADTAPSKIVPAAQGKDAQSNKLITDRVNERGQSEKLVSREEQPLDRPTAVALQSAPQAALGSGIVASEPKKVRTIAIHPDQPVMADAGPSAMSATAVPGKPTSAPRVATVPPRPTLETTADAEEPAAPARSAQPHQAGPVSSNSPLSLNPNAAPSRAAPPRTASVTPQAPAATAIGGPGSYVQVSSQRSESEAQAAFRSLQAKFPEQLRGRQPYIHKVDLGAKGTYYRAMVGPFANAGEASQLCLSLKAAGGQCLVQRN